MQHWVQQQLPHPHRMQVSETVTSMTAAAIGVVTLASTLSTSLEQLPVMMTRIEYVLRLNRTNGVSRLWNACHGLLATGWNLADGLCFTRLDVRENSPAL